MEPEPGRVGSGDHRGRDGVSGRRSYPTRAYQPDTTVVGTTVEAITGPSQKKAVPANRRGGFHLPP